MMISTGRIFLIDSQSRVTLPISQMHGSQLHILGNKLFEVSTMTSSSIQKQTEGRVMDGREGVSLIYLHYHRHDKE